MSEVEERDQKRRRIGSKECAPASSCCSITDLPDFVLKECLSFLGPGNYRFVAGTCHSFQEQYSFPTTTTWANAVTSVSCAKFCLEDNSPKNRNEVLDELQHTAASLGKVKVLQWALGDHSRALGLEDFAAAGNGDHLNVLEWGEGNGMDWFSPNLCRGAAGNGHVHILEWSHQRNRGIQDMQDLYAQHPASDAAQGGHITALEWLNEKDLMPADTSYIWIGAIIENRVHILDWLYDNGIPVSQYIGEIASKSGHIGVLEWAKNHGIPLTVSACSHAASIGNLGVLKWLRDKNCPWDERTISWAEMNGHLNIVQWARENGCPEPQAEMI